MTKRGLQRDARKPEPMKHRPSIVQEGRWPCACGLKHSNMMETCPAWPEKLDVPIPANRKKPTKDEIR